MRIAILLVISSASFVTIANDTQAQAQSIRAEGNYTHHLQGICVDDEFIYWSFTTTLLKTDREGNRVASIPVDNHHGDLCWHDGKLYVAVNLGEFNNPDGNANSWVYVYDAESLREIARHETQEVFHGAGGMGFYDDRFYIVGGLPDGVEENYVYEYDSEFTFVNRHVIESGHTHLGIQTATFAHDRWWFGCYGDPKILLVTNSDFELLGRYEFDCSLGIVGARQGQLFAATGPCTQSDGCIGTIHLVVPNEENGLKRLAEDAISD